MSEWAARTPESLTRLERAWLRRRFCSWCEARTDQNQCLCTVDSSRKWLGERCTTEFLNERRGRWLAENYKPRTPPPGDGA